MDSGAAKTISGDLSIIEDYKAYTNPIFMYTITGSRMSILGEGHIGSCLSQVFYSPEADCTVVATKDLQRQGLMTVFPPGENQGCWIIDPKTGAIIIRGDKNYDMSIDQMKALKPAGETIAET